MKTPFHLHFTLLLAAAGLHGDSGNAPSATPEAGTAVPRIIEVCSFGAVPDDDKNDFPAIRAAIEAAQEKTPSIVRFQPGRYILEDGGGAMAQHQFLALTGTRDITLEGNGAAFELRNPQLGFLATVQSENIAVHDLFIDYNPLPFTSGRILEVDPEDNRIRMELLPGHPAPDIEPLQSVALKAWMCIHDPEEPGRIARDVNNFILLQRFERLSPTVFDIYAQPGGGPRFRAASPGMVVSIIGRSPGAQLFASQGNRGITYEGVTVYTSPELVFVFVDTQDITVRYCRILVPEGRFKSANGDGFHAQNCRGPIRIENNTFEGQVDDAINIYSKMALADTAGPAPGQLVLSRRMGASSRCETGRFLKGDPVVVYDLREGRVAHETVVSGSENARREVHLSSVPNDLEITDNERYVLFNQGLCRDVRITGNTLRNNRRFGIFLKASDVLIRDNTFQGMSGTAIMISYEKHYWEAGFSRNIRIEQNRFHNTGFEAGYTQNRYMGTISILPGAVEAFNGLPKLDPGLEAASDIAIHDNLFMDPDTEIILGYASDIKLSGNRFRQVDSLGAAFSLPVTQFHVRGFQACGNEATPDNRHAP